MSPAIETVGNSVDLEYGPPPTPSKVDPVGQPATSELQDLQTELHEFLAVYSEKLISLQKSLPSKEEHPPPKEAQTISVRSDFDGSPPQMCRAESPDFNDDIKHHAVLGNHSHHLRQFLDRHMKNIRSLQDVIHYPPTGKHPEKETNEKAFESLTDQFNMLVVISTFTASLIVSFIALVKSIVLDDHRIPFDVGMLLSFLAMSVHFGNIIVAGRGAALATQHAVDEEEHHDLAYFHHYLEICEQLQFFATNLFLVSIVILSFFVFSDIAFPLVLLGVSILGGLIVFWSAYWRVSMTLRNLKFIIKRVRQLRFRSSSYIHRRSS